MRESHTPAAAAQLQPLAGKERCSFPGVWMVESHMEITMPLTLDEEMFKKLLKAAQHAVGADR